MRQKLLHTGFSNYVLIDKIIAIMNSDSAPVKRMIINGKKDGNVLDVTHGRKTKSVIVLENRQLLLSAINTDKLAERISKELIVSREEEGKNV
ncbi:MAG TPA: DUF370 domain-containing protein [Candidatus Eremiobacteraeota bacterium]|nr:MAG: hypothetical protein BWY64_03122 [bacterium ADurb.Bin363]HPZ07622.1 DUF370 domain-containing protein [Candidatus Eremiobacteraeota bacterium]